MPVLDPATGSQGLKAGAVLSNQNHKNTMKPPVKITLKKTKDCKGSVRFDAQKTTPPQPLENVYVSRILPGINEAQEITVTIEVP